MVLTADLKEDMVGTELTETGRVFQMAGLVGCMSQW